MNLTISSYGMTVCGFPLDRVPLDKRLERTGFHQSGHTLAVDPQYPDCVGRDEAGEFQQPDQGSRINSSRPGKSQRCRPTGPEALEAWQQGEITYRRALRLVGVDTIADLYSAARSSGVDIRIEPAARELHLSDRAIHLIDREIERSVSEAPDGSRRRPESD